MVRRRRKKVNFQTGRNQANNNNKDWGKSCYVHHVGRGSHTQQKAILYMQTKQPVLCHDHVVFDRISDGIVIIGLIPDSEPQSNAGFVVFLL